MNNKTPWIIGIVVLGLGYYAYKSGALSSLTSSSSSTTTSNPTQVVVGSAPPDPGQLQNISQALGALTNEVNAQPHPATTLGTAPATSTSK